MGLSTQQIWSWKVTFCLAWKVCCLLSKSEYVKWTKMVEEVLHWTNLRKQSMYLQVQLLSSSLVKEAVPAPCSHTFYCYEKGHLSIPHWGDFCRELTGREPAQEMNCEQAEEACPKDMENKHYWSPLLLWVFLCSPWDTYTCEGMTTVAERSESTAFSLSKYVGAPGCGNTEEKMKSA